MNIDAATKWTIEIPVDAMRQRLWQIIPGVLSWGTLLGLTILAFVLPFWVAIFVIAYDIYSLVRVAYMSVHLVYAYRRLRQEQTIDWNSRCCGVSGDISLYKQELKNQLTQLKQLPKRQTLLEQQLKGHIDEVATIINEKRNIADWRKVEHIVVIPTYNESLTVLRTTLSALSHSTFPHDRLHVVVGFEERAGEPACERAQKLCEEFSGQFRTFLTTFHPDGIPGEARVKSANASWAVKMMEKELAKLGIKTDQVLVSNFDSDTVVGPQYFSCLTYAFITHPDRYHVSYQPLPMYNNNLWDAPAFSRVIATSSTFWQMIESTRPERLVTFSSHSMTLRALKDVGYWQPDVVSEDSRIFWQCLLHYNGRYQTYPLYTTVSMDAALADSWWRTFTNQYKQKRRWAWGIENFVYLAEGFYRNKKIPWRVKWTYLYRTLEGHHSWATAPIILAGLGWLPVLFGGPEFHSTVLSYHLPYVTRTIMSIAMSGLIISTSLSLLLLPPKPSEYKGWRYAMIVLQWVLVPFIATILSALPALDSETRLMIGRDLSFNVMEKARKREA